MRANLELTQGLVFSGTLLQSGKPIPGIEVRLRKGSPTACEQADIITRTDEAGRFSVPATYRRWSWLGWANNHSISGCVLLPSGPARFGLRAINDPTVIDVQCDFASPVEERCQFLCTDGFDGRC